MTLDSQALLSMATSSHEAGRWEEAERLYRSILATDPDQPDALHQIGALAHQNGHHDTAIAYVRRAIERMPSRAVFHNTLGGALLASGDAATATTAFQRALQLNPKSIEIQNNLANALQSNGRLEDAIAIYTAILETAPSHADVHNNLGYAFQIKGDFDAAIRHFRAACAASPENELAWSQLGNALCGRGSYQEAAEACLRAVALDPHSAMAHTNLGNALFGLKRHDEAIGAYRSALALAPQLADVHNNLGIVYQLLGQSEQADECFASARALNPSEDADVALGHMYYALGRLEDAEAAYRRGHDKRPHDAECLFALGNVLNDLGRHTEGLEAIARGPGLAHISLVSDAPFDTAPQSRRTKLGGNKPHFIGSWHLRDSRLCEQLIALFDRLSAFHTPGRTTMGIDLSIKKATDLIIFPRDVEKTGFEAVFDYLRELEECARDYALQWPHLAETMPRADLVPFKIQRYRSGEHFQKPHCERVTFGLMHRVLAWMTYLNDVEDGGVTRFHHYDIDVTPKRGLTLIWPGEWTHTHSGGIVNAGTKYILTGWMHFPHPAPKG